MMWPYTLIARGLIASTGGRAEPASVVPFGLLLDGGFDPRRLLLVSVAIAVSALAKVSIHSGRSIIVAPAASAAPRVLIRMSVSVHVTSAGLSGVRGSHSPVPSALNLAT